MRLLPLAAVLLVAACTEARPDDATIQRSNALDERIEPVVKAAVLERAGNVEPLRLFHHSTGLTLDGRLIVCGTFFGTGENGSFVAYLDSGKVTDLTYAPSDSERSVRECKESEYGRLLEALRTRPEHVERLLGG